MNIDTPERKNSGIEEILDGYAGQLRRLAQTLEVSISKVEGGDTGADTEVGKTVGRMRDWLKAALDLEARIIDEQRKATGRTHDNELDLEAARVEIWSRFDRLVRADSDQDVSG
jgi:hypothetical protein